MALDGVKKPGITPPTITIVAPAGAGKTTLGALFPAALFIQAEEISTVFDEWEEADKPDALPLLPAHDLKLKKSPFDQIMKQLDQIGREPVGELPYRTLVIDSVSVLNMLIETEIYEKDGAQNIAAACGGFHKGYLVAAAWHQKIIERAKRVARRHDMALIFLSHSIARKQRNRPDAEEHTIWSLDMGDAAAQTYIRLSDAVLFIYCEEYVRGGEESKKGVTTKSGKVVSTGKRILITSPEGKMGFTQAKNRMNLDAQIPLPLEQNPLLGLIPYYRAK